MVAEASGSRRAIQINEKQGFYIGSHAAGEASFVGFIARVAVWASADENLVLSGRSKMHSGSERNLIAYFPLDRAHVKPSPKPLRKDATEAEVAKYTGDLIATKRSAFNLVAGGRSAIVLPSMEFNERLRERKQAAEREKLMKSVSSDLSWTKDKELLASGMFPTFVDDELMKASDIEGEARAKQVKAAMERTWASYKRFVSCAYFILFFAQIEKEKHLTTTT